MARIFVAVRFTHTDRCFFLHFMKYYLSLGVNLFLINFNYRFDENKCAFDDFIGYVNTSEYLQYIRYNIGPNTLETAEGGNINMLKELVKEHACENDYIIPADSDEFHKYSAISESLIDLITMMSTNNITYIHGPTCERISDDGSVIPIKEDIDIFIQFPKNNPKLFVQPKVSIIHAKYYRYIGVGHHYIEKATIDKLSIVTKYGSITHHFRWNLQGKERITNWIKLWSNSTVGWKDIKKYEKMLAIFETNLIEYC